MALTQPLEPGAPLSANPEDFNYAAYAWIDFMAQHLSQWHCLVVDDGLVRRTYSPLDPDRSYRGLKIVFDAPQAGEVGGLRRLLSAGKHKFPAEIFAGANRTNEYGGRLNQGQFCRPDFAPYEGDIDLDLLALITHDMPEMINQFRADCWEHSSRKPLREPLDDLIAQIVASGSLPADPNRAAKGLAQLVKSEHFIALPKVYELKSARPVRPKQRVALPRVESSSAWVTRYQQRANELADDTATLRTLADVLLNSLGDEADITAGGRTWKKEKVRGIVYLFGIDNKEVGNDGKPFKRVVASAGQDIPIWDLDNQALWSAFATAAERLASVAFDSLRDSDRRTEELESAAATIGIYLTPIAKALAEPSELGIDGLK